MRYSVNASELLEVESYKPEQRTHYFLTRAIEAEEVWGLSNPSGWVMKNENKTTILPVWPNEQMAARCAGDEWCEYTAASVSLEHFVYQLLPAMQAQDIRVELLPTPGRPGSLVNARELAAIFEGLMESGEYYMEG